MRLRVAALTEDAGRGVFRGSSDGTEGLWDHVILQYTLLVLVCPKIYKSVLPQLLHTDTHTNTSRC